MQDTKAKNKTAVQSITRVTYVGLLGNVFLAIVKTSAGLFFGSMALVADGVHSISDLLTDMAILLGAHFGSKEPDPEHPYGHGRFETFSALFVAIVLIFFGGAMIQKSAAMIAQNSMKENSAVWPGIGTLIVAGVSVFIKEWLYRYNRREALRLHSSALYANAWHHRSDALSSVVVFIGLVAQMGGYRYGDELAAIAVGLMVILVGVRVIGECIHEFAERSVDNDTIEHIKNIIQSRPGIRGYHKLRTRSAGREIFIDLHILVDPSLNICKAHEISMELEEHVNEQIARPVNIMVHIEPDLPEERKDQTLTKYI
jgi:cation diffusion facilitator family transporter